MAINQERIRQLVEYIQLESGDAGYVPLASLYLAIDSDNFGAKPFKFPLQSLLVGGGGDGVVKQMENLLSRNVSESFPSAFASKPVATKFEVYRFQAIGGGEYIKQPVLHTYTGANWVTTTGFAITIDASESLTGVIIDYEFKEQS